MGFKGLGIIKTEYTISIKFMGMKLIYQEGLSTKQLKMEFYHRLRARGIKSVSYYTHGNYFFEMVIVRKSEILAILTFSENRKMSVEVFKRDFPGDPTPIIQCYYQKQMKRAIKM